MLNIITFNTQRDFRKEQVHRDVLSLIQAQRTKSILCLQEVTPDLTYSITTWQKEQNEKIRLIQCGENAIYLSPDIKVKGVKEVIIGEDRSFIGATFEIGEIQASIYSGKLQPGLWSYKRRKGLEKLLSQVETRRCIIGMDSNMWLPNEKESTFRDLGKNFDFKHSFAKKSIDLKRSEHRTGLFRIFSDKSLERISSGIDGFILKGHESTPGILVRKDIQSSDHFPVQINI